MSAGGTSEAGEMPPPFRTPTPIDPPRGCAFHPRCPLAQPICAEVAPPAYDHGGGQVAACHVTAPKESVHA